MKHEKMAGFENVELKDGFWLDRYKLNKQVSVDSVLKRFDETGRVDALRFDHAETGKPLHMFYDSDMYKWIEAVAYLYAFDPASQKDNVRLIDELTARMAKAQTADGYLNSYHQQIEPQNVFKLRDHHELYTFGHLIEAAVAYARYVGKIELLNIAEKTCDCVYRAFISEKTAAFTTPGHEEIELALMKLYRYTGNEKYLEMAKFFITERGKYSENRDSFNNSYQHNLFVTQDDTDVYNLHEAVGHAVRALYFYCGVADFAEKTGDEKLLKNLNDVFDDIYYRKSYVTGGVGSTYRSESFTKAYDLPNHTAYSESCAAIAVVLFCLRMRKTAANAKYGALAERALYNAVLSPVSLDGKAFFYENPLEIDLARYDREIAVSKQYREHLPITQRVEVFKCSCCPPNINRFFAEIGDAIAFVGDEGVSVEQYIPSRVKTGFGCVEISGDYAVCGKISVSSSDYKSNRIALRIPEWCDDFSAAVDGKPVTPELTNGYAYFDVREKFDVTVDFHIRPKFVCADPRVTADDGRVAFTYGPIVYCLEGKDNGSRLNELSVFVDVEPKEDGTYGGFKVFCLDGFRDRSQKKLYYDAKSQECESVKLKFIPYYTFANRGESDMLVWVRKK